MLYVGLFLFWNNWCVCCWFVWCSGMCFLWLGFVGGCMVGVVELCDMCCVGCLLVEMCDVLDICVMLYLWSILFCCVVVGVWCCLLCVCRCFFWLLVWFSFGGICWLMWECGLILFNNCLVVLVWNLYFVWVEVVLVCGYEFICGCFNGYVCMMCICNEVFYGCVV